MKSTVSALLVLIFFTATSSAIHAVTEPSLPVEPDEDSRLEEIYDHEASMMMFLYSLKGDGNVDYVTGRKVVENQRSVYGNPVYYVEPFPQFYWWNHAMWNDPERDGVNGNETLYAENTEFDTSRYKPCLFNGQPC
ncbi:MAG: hypothetical protein NPIRA04_18780 [Nitrospirales bacterium]|nr:MAG: hypothetical protein NPIRA04_18780 [Nitrospirales bacterium]